MPAPFRTSPFHAAPLRPGRAPRPFTVGGESSGDVVRIGLDGEVDLASADALQTALDGILRHRPRLVAIEVWGLTFIDVHGLRVLERTGRTVREAGGSVLLVGASRLVRTLLELARTSRLFQFEPSLTA